MGNSNSIATHAVSICNLLAHTFVLKNSELVQLSTEKQVRAWIHTTAFTNICENYFRIKTIDELAIELNIDPAYLSLVFRRFHNDTPYSFLIRLKMGHAASLLLSSRRLVKDIAFELGYENLSIFRELLNQFMEYLRKFSAKEIIFLFKFKNYEI